MNIATIPTPSSLIHLEQFSSNLLQTDSFLSDFISPNLEKFIRDYLKVLTSLVIPLLLLYFAILARIKTYHKIFQCLISLSLVALWTLPYAISLECGFSMTIRNGFVFSAMLKLLDLWVRRNAFPIYNMVDQTRKNPSDWTLSLLLVAEMRYESFTPNYVKLPDGTKTSNETWELVIHLAIFGALSAVPIQHPTLLALRILLSIYICGTMLHMLFRFKNSPALFGPIYRADSLAGFWSETWHNVYASACVSLMYLPIRNTLRYVGVPKLLSHAMGIVGVFSLMAVFHMYAGYPVLATNTLIRVGLFFFLNGVGMIAEGLVWGKKKHWIKTMLAWTFEVLLATWTADSMTDPFVPVKCSAGSGIH